MSETSKTAETAKKVTDNTARSSQANIDVAGRATKESIVEAGQGAQNSANSTKEADQSVIETMGETAAAAASISAKAAEQSREVLMIGMRTVTGVGSRVADISLGRGHHLMSSTAHAMDVYRDASERSAEQVQALLSSVMSLGRGLQRMQHAWLEMADHAMEKAAHKPQDLLHCKNIVELAEVQRDLYLGAVNHAFESTSRLLDLAGRTAQEAMRPLQSLHH
jgi:Phasin protein